MRRAELRFTWRHGVPWVDHDPQAIGERLEALRVRDGALTPQAVVADAEPPASPLHALFEWDDATAAAAYRLHQARQVISAIRVTSVAPMQREPVPAFVRVTTTAATGHYQPIWVVLQNRDQRQVLLARARAELEAWRRRYANLRELADMFAAIDAHLPAAD
jgi:hypothetical protein